MCVIVIKEAGIEIEKDVVAAMFAANPHGMGLATQARNGGFIVRKALDLVSATKMITAVTSKLAVIHFRYATSGKINVDQVHPFAVDRNPIVNGYTSKALLFHNGVISGLGDKRFSDTAMFCSDILAKSKTKLWPKLCQTTGSKYVLWMPESLPIMIGKFGPYKQLTVSNWVWTRYKERESEKKVVRVIDAWSEVDEDGEGWKNDYYYNRSWSLIK